MIANVSAAREYRAQRIESEYTLFVDQRGPAGPLLRRWIMAGGKLLQFPMRNPDLFSQQINQQVLRNSEFNEVLYAAIRALPHVQNLRCREELKRALCNLLIREDGVA